MAIDPEDLIDSDEVATILGLSSRNTVSQYQQRYETMPRPVVDKGPSKVKLWSRAAIVQWQETRRRRS